MALGTHRIFRYMFKSTHTDYQPKNKWEKCGEWVISNPQYSKNQLYKSRNIVVIRKLIGITTQQPVLDCLTCAEQRYTAHSNLIFPFMT